MLEVKSRVFPMVLNELGDALGRNVDSGLDTVWDFRYKIGYHEHCGGSIAQVIISVDYAVLVCKECNLRIAMPKEIDTYAKLRAHFAKFNPSRGGGGGDGSAG